MSQSRDVASDAVLERVIREHGAVIARVARGYADNAHDADDLMQEIWTALWRALPAFRGEASERTFVLRVAHNRGISFAVARRRFASLGEAAEISDPAPIAESRVISAERRDRLFDAIRRLPDTQREAVMLQLRDCRSARSRSFRERARVMPGSGSPGRERRYARCSWRTNERTGYRVAGVDGYLATHDGVASCHPGGVETVGEGAPREHRRKDHRGRGGRECGPACCVGAHARGECIRGWPRCVRRCCDRCDLDSGAEFVAASSQETLRAPSSISFVLRRARQQRMRLAEFVWIVVVLDLIFLIPWWIMEADFTTGSPMPGTGFRWLPILGFIALSCGRSSLAHGKARACRGGSAICVVSRRD